jgi:hypothetical protein
MGDIVGATFPVPKHCLEQVFCGRKAVMIRPATLFRDLRRGMKLVFYQSTEEMGCVGEATIMRVIITGDPCTFIEAYGDAVFINPEEQEKAGCQWMALELAEILRYDRPVTPDRPVPARGRYLRE